MGKMVKDTTGRLYSGQQQQQQHIYLGGVMVGRIIKKLKSQPTNSWSIHPFLSLSLRLLDMCAGSSSGPVDSI
jgi:hypothetical protein